MGFEADEGSGILGESDVVGKGKGVATGEPDREPTKQTAAVAVLSRLGKSAAGLSKSVFQGASPASDLANISASGKNETPASSSHFDPQAASSSRASTSSSSGNAPSRPGQADAHIAAEERAFSDFLDSTPVFVPTETKELEKAWEAASIPNTSPATYRSSQGMMTSSVAEQQERDGVEVVRLLSQVDDEGPEYPEGVSLTEAELGSLRHALFEDGSPGQISAVDWNNVLNFIPDFFGGQDAIYGATGASESSLMNFGHTDTLEAGQQWLAEWNRVLTSYNDEVWGDLGHLVQQARTEVQELKDDQVAPTPDPTALRRLRIVLTRARARL